MCSPERFDFEEDKKLLLPDSCIFFSVKNREVAGLLYEMAELLELHVENRFKIIAFSKAARAIESLPEDISLVCREKRLQSIPGVGKAIAQEVEEYLKTGLIKAHQELLAKTPSGLVELLKISGLGPKTVFMLHEKLNITNLEELEMRPGSIASEGFLGWDRRAKQTF